MMEVKKVALRHGVSLVGHCTDSASNALSALLTRSSPSTYKHVVESATFMGLPRKDFTFFAPILCPGFPSIAYPCWNHSGRTSVRNLMNSNISIVAGILPSGKDRVQLYSVANIQDLLTLKKKYPNAAVCHADIIPNIKQKCDATVRVISAVTIQQFGARVPESHSTQLYLKTSLWVHEPYRNTKFGSPVMLCEVCGRCDDLEEVEKIYTAVRNPDTHQSLHQSCPLHDFGTDGACWDS